MKKWHLRTIFPTLPKLKSLSCRSLGVLLLLSFCGSLLISSSASAYTGSFGCSYRINGPWGSADLTSCSSDHFLYPNEFVTSFQYFYSQPRGQTQGFPIGSEVIITGSIYYNYQYSEGAKNKPLEVTCPVVTNDWFQNQSCEFDTFTDVASTRHNFIYNYVITGHVTRSVATDSITFGTFIHVISSDNGGYIAFGNPYASSYVGASSADYSSILSDIRSQQTSILNHFTSSNGKLDTVLSTLSALPLDDIISQSADTNDKLDEQTDLMSQQLQAQQEANEQQQAQYEAEKQEESDRESSQSDSADEMAGLFSFSALNPFSGLFSLFGAGGTCVSIPTLSSWLHTEQTQVCPLFSNSVRNIVTPVLGISSMMLLFGFFVRWLKGGGFNGSIDNSGGTD